MHLAAQHAHITPREHAILLFAGQRLQLVSQSQASHAASRLVGRMYAQRGLDMRAHQKDGQSQASQLVLTATDAGEVFGTMTLAFDSPSGLSAEGSYGREIAALRQRGAFICEVTRLAIEDLQGSKPLLAALFQLAHIHSRQIRRMTDMVIEVHPRHAPFYMRMLGFRKLGAETLCPRVNAPAILLHGDLAYADEQIARHAGLRGAGVKSLYPYFLPAEAQHRLLASGE